MDTLPNFHPPDAASQISDGRPPCLIDIKELSRRIGTPKGTLYNLVYLRRIPFVKRGRSLRFDHDEVLRSMPHFRPTEGSVPRR